MRTLLFYAFMLLLITASSCKKDATGTATIIYQDSLTTNDQTWAVDSTNYHVRKFDQGHYSIRMDSSGYIIYSPAPYANINFPYTVQVDGITLLDNTNMLGSVALVFNRQDSANFAVAEICTNGTYRIWQKAHGANSTLVNYTFSTAIQTTSGSKNTIKVIQNQSNAELQVNNVLIGTFNVSLPSGLVETGPAASTGTSNFTPVTGLFNNFSIWKN